MHKLVEVGGVQIGDGAKVFTVVELGVCHEQKVELAEHFIEVAARSGAQAVKVEAFQADELVVDRSIEHEYGTVTGRKKENYYSLLKRLELSYEEHARLKRKADQEGILFFSTVHNKPSVDFMYDLGVCAFKIASPDVINYPLLRYLAKTGRPIFMDTGGAFIGEIERAVTLLANAGAKDLIIMHNPAGYPAPPEKTDLRMIPMMKTLFNIPVGLSCHTPGFDMVVAAVALGANVVEKPIARSRYLESPEHIFSFLDTEAAEFVTKIRTVETSLGQVRRTTVEEKSLPRFIGRRGLYAAADLAAGEVLSEKNLLPAKPWQGISIEFIDEVVGKRLKKALKKHTPIHWGDLEA
ncbi:MAG: N-acetylneuraminate synthase family protein [Candidatus Margulisiibacteriota bacterium]